MEDARPGMQASKNFLLPRDLYLGSFSLDFFPAKGEMKLWGC